MTESRSLRPGRQTSRISCFMNSSCIEVLVARRSRIVGPALFLLLSFFATAGCSKENAETPSGDHEVTASVLMGAWVRPDGGYILQIREARPDGGLKAGYFNPSPIQVGSASWRMVGSVLKLEVVLDDQNYRGSNYTLVYHPETDQLEGVYYQAVARQSFDVVFVRRAEADGS